MPWDGMMIIQKGIFLLKLVNTTHKNSIKLALHAKKDTHNIENDGTTNARIFNENKYILILELKITRTQIILGVIAGASWDKDDVKKES